MSHAHTHSDEHDNEVTLTHKTPKKTEVNRDFTTKTLQQQVDKAIELEKHKNKPLETFEEKEELDPDIDSYTPETDEKKLKEIHI